MAGIFHEAVLTTKGLALLTKAMGGLCDIELTKAATGDGSYTDSEDITQRTALKSQQQEFLINATKVWDSTNVLVRWTATNYKSALDYLAAGYYIKEIGLFATDPDEGEILYAIATAVTDQWDWMPEYNGLIPVKINFDMMTEVDNSSNVTISMPNRMHVYDEGTGDEYVVSIDNEKMFFEQEDGSHKHFVADQSEIDAIVNVYGGKNLLPYPYKETTKTENGITYRDNGDGTVTVSGTATADSSFQLWEFLDDSGNKKQGYDNIYNQKIILSGCPPEGSDSTFYTAFFRINNSADYVIDSGDGVEFQYSRTTVGSSFAVIVVSSGTVISAPITFYPMIRDARISDPTYVPYAMTNRELTLATNANRRTRRDITNDLANLSQAVSEQNLAKYGYAIGDYFVGNSGYTYILADKNPFKGTATPYCIASNHIGIVVNTYATSQWHTGSAASVGYAGSSLHTYLTGTVLDNIKADFKLLFGGSTGLEHLLPHSKLLTNALASWDWSANQYISALTCTQIDAGSQWTANGYQEGEASKSLELFRTYKWTEIFGGEYFWLRNISNYDNTASYACYALSHGVLDGYNSVTDALYAVGLINFY